MSEPKYPEHEKMRRLKPESQAIGEFLDWFQEARGGVLAVWREEPAWRDGGEWVQWDGSIERALAEFFEIDLEKVGAEKDAMVEEMRRTTKAALDRARRGVER